jgi:hypothetical protein
MSVSHDTPNPLEAEIYDNLAFTYDPKTQTVQWEEKTPMGQLVSVDITQDEETRKHKITGSWWERGGDIQFTNEHPGRTFIQTFNTPSGQVSRVASLMYPSHKRKDDQSGFKSQAARALISE